MFFDYSHFYKGIEKSEDNEDNEDNIDETKLKNYFTENDFDLKIGSGKLNINQAYNILKKEFDLKIKYTEFFNLYRDIFRENTEMKNFLETRLLDSEYNLYMLSNVDASHINFVDKHYPYVKHVKKRILSYKVRSIKPEKKIFRELIKKFKLDPVECLFVDDLKNNILTAGEFGFNTIHYTSHKKFLKEFDKLTKKD